MSGALVLEEKRPPACIFPEVQICVSRSTTTENLKNWASQRQKFPKSIPKDVVATTPCTWNNSNKKINDNEKAYGKFLKFFHHSLGQSALLIRNEYYLFSQTKLPLMSWYGSPIIHEYGLLMQGIGTRGTLHQDHHAPTPLNMQHCRRYT